MVQAEGPWATPHDGSACRNACPAPVYSPIQKEVIVLAAVLYLIDDMVNLRTFGRPITDRPTNLLPNTSTDQRVFAILLGDFRSLPQAHRSGVMPFGLSAPTQDETGSARTYLRYLGSLHESELYVR